MNTPPFDAFEPLFTAEEIRLRVEELGRAISRDMRDSENVVVACVLKGAIVFMAEAGHGLQLNDGSTEFATHSVEEMVQLTAGRAGGLQPGRHIDAAGAHPAQNLISAMQATGYEGDTLGEVTGNIPSLFGA